MQLARSCEELVDNTVQNKFADNLEGDKIFRPNLGGVENVEFKVMLVRLRNSLNAEFPLGGTAVLDGLVEILAMEVGILSANFQSLIPHKTSASTRVKALTPKPCMMRYERGIPRSGITHMTMWADSG